MRKIKNKQNISSLASIGEKVKLGENVKIYPNVIISGNSEIGSGSVIYPNTTIEDSVIGENCVVKSSFIENSFIENAVSIGPFAHLRPNCKVADGCKIGNFVEIKNSTLGKETKVSHLAYVGDADVGENCNIGCGAIFVNYDGKVKHRTHVGNNCFIGSNCNVIAPVDVANNTYLCAGTTLTVDTHDKDFVIGRARECVKPDRAQNYLKEIK